MNQTGCTPPLLTGLRVLRILTKSAWSAGRFWSRCGPVVWIACACSLPGSTTVSGLTGLRHKNRVDDGDSWGEPSRVKASPGGPARPCLSWFQNYGFELHFAHK